MEYIRYVGERYLEKTIAIEGCAQIVRIIAGVNKFKMSIHTVVSSPFPCCRNNWIKVKRNFSMHTYIIGDAVYGAKVCWVRVSVVDAYLIMEVELQQKQVKCSSSNAGCLRH